MFQDLIVKTIRGVPVHFSEIARIADGYEEQRTLALINGQRALALEIRKQSGSNTVDVAEAVKEASADTEPGTAGADASWRCPGFVRIYSRSGRRCKNHDASSARSSPCLLSFCFSTAGAAP